MRKYSLDPLLQSKVVQEHLVNKINELVQSLQTQNPGLATEDIQALIRQRVYEQIKAMGNNASDDETNWVISPLKSQGDDKLKKLEEHLAESGIESEIIAQLLDQLQSPED